MRESKGGFSVKLTLDACGNLDRRRMSKIERKTQESFISYGEKEDLPHS